MIDTRHLLKVVFAWVTDTGRLMTNVSSAPIISTAVTFAVICFGLSDPARLYAVPSQMSHEMSGTVQRIERQKLTILLTGESKPTVFAWNTNETKFVRDGAFTNVDALRVGTYVTIRCSHPIFGSKPLLYRVAWQTGASQKK
jgi:hypothetical protein